jgi:hypothetical protein
MRWLSPSILLLQKRTAHGVFAVRCVYRLLSPAKFIGPEGLVGRLQRRFHFFLGFLDILLDQLNLNLDA